MNRAIEEVAASQQKLRQRLSSSKVPDSSEMIIRLREHSERMLDLLRGAGNVELLEVDYAKLLESPNESLPCIAEFSKIDSARLDLMASAIDPSLRHFGMEVRHLA